MQFPCRFASLQLFLPFVAGALHDMLGTCLHSQAVVELKISSEMEITLSSSKPTLSVSDGQLNCVWDPTLAICFQLRTA